MLACGLPFLQAAAGRSLTHLPPVSEKTGCPPLSATHRDGRGMGREMAHMVPTRHHLSASLLSTSLPSARPSPVTNAGADREHQHHPLTIGRGGNPDGPSLGGCRP